MARLLCRLGLHRWRQERTGDGVTFLRCAQCGRDGDGDGAAALRAGWWS